MFITRQFLKDNYACAAGLRRFAEAFKGQRRIEITPENMMIAAEKELNLSWFLGLLRHADLFALNRQHRALMAECHQFAYDQNKIHASETAHLTGELSDIHQVESNAHHQIYRDLEVVNKNELEAAKAVFDTEAAAATTAAEYDLADLKYGIAFASSNVKFSRSLLAKRRQWDVAHVDIYMRKAEVMMEVEQKLALLNEQKLEHKRMIFRDWCIDAARLLNEIFSDLEKEKIAK